MDRNDLIRHMAHARSTHVQWARYQSAERRAGRKPVPNVGSETHHRKWVRVYDAVLATLRSVVERDLNDVAY